MFPLYAAAEGELSVKLFQERRQVRTELRCGARKEAHGCPTGRQLHPIAHPRARVLRVRSGGASPPIGADLHAELIPGVSQSNVLLVIAPVDCGRVEHPAWRRPPVQAIAKQRQRHPRAALRWQLGDLHLGRGVSREVGAKCSAFSLEVLADHLRQLPATGLAMHPSSMPASLKFSEAVPRRTFDREHLSPGRNRAAVRIDCVGYRTAVVPAKIRWHALRSRWVCGTKGRVLSHNGVNKRHSADLSYFWGNLGELRTERLFAARNALHESFQRQCFLNKVQGAHVAQMWRTVFFCECLPIDQSVH